MDLSEKPLFCLSAVAVDSDFTLAHTDRMKTAFIIAGFDIHDTAASDPYTVLEAGLRKKGYQIVACDISWHRKTPSQYAAEFLDFYNQRKSEHNIVIGNSFGAVIAFVTATQLQPDHVYICSLSPFFAEDRSKYPNDYGVKWFGKRRLVDLRSTSASDIAKRISQLGIKTTIAYGEKEHQTSPALVARCIETAQAIKGSRLVEIPSAPHDMTDEVYSRGVAALV